MISTSKKTIFLLVVFAAAVLSVSYVIPQKTTVDGFVHNEETGFRDTINTLTVTVAGDAMAHKPQTDAAYLSSENRHDFSGMCTYLRPILAESQLNILNLETTLDGEPYTGYPQFSAPDAFADAFEKAGFNFFVLANNHCADRGNRGASRTLNVLKKLNIPSAGTYLDSADRVERYPAIIIKNGVKVAILNYTYGTNGLNLQPPLSVNYLTDTLQIINDISDAKSKSPDIILALLHWGNEYETQPSRWQKQQARFFLSHGIDVIVGSHPHVIQPFEWFAYDNSDTTKKKPVFWSLGNLVSNQRKPFTDGGVMARFTISKNKTSGEVSITEIMGIPYWVYKRIEHHPGYFILPAQWLISHTELFPFTQEDRRAFDFFCTETTKTFPLNFQ